MKAKLMASLTRFLREEDGTEVVEWALVAGLIIVLAVGVFAAIGGNVSAIMGLVNDKLNTACTAAGGTGCQATP